jgi:hypothetical protein
MNKQKRKLIATFKGKEAQALHNDRAEITGTYRESKGVYELYMTMEKEFRNRLAS